jgi:hypothetical protein
MDRYFDGRKLTGVLLVHFEVLVDTFPDFVIGVLDVVLGAAVV